MTTTTSSERAELHALLSEMGDEEIRVVLLLGRRLLAGQRAYGALNLRQDRRNFVAEAGEEWADAAIYLAMDQVRASLPARR